MTYRSTWRSWWLTPFRGVDQQDGQVAALQGVETLEDGDLLDDRFRLPLGSNPGGVDQKVLFFLPADDDVDGVPRRPGHLGGDDPLEARQRVHQGGFPDIGSPDHRDPGDPFRIGRRFVFHAFPGGNPGHDLLEDPVDPRTVLRRQREDPVDRERMELVDAFLPLPGIHLVRGEEERLVPLPEHPRDLPVERQETVLRVHHEDDEVGFVDGPQHLGADLLDQVVPAARHVAAGIDDREMASVVFRRQGDQIARDPRLVEGDGAPLPGDPVEQGGFADVRPPDQRDGEISRVHIPDASVSFRFSTIPSRPSRTFPSIPGRRSLSPVRGGPKFRLFSGCRRPSR